MHQTASREIYERRINRVVDYIRAHLAEPLPLVQLARVAHFSPFHFHRLFRALVGEPLHAFVRRLRLERAVFQMTHGPPATLTEIALAWGFASSSDFSRAFKQAYGFAPRRYTRQEFLRNSKIRQELRGGADYVGGMRSRKPNLDRFRVRLVDRPARRVAYVRVVGSYDAARLHAALERLLDWGRRDGVAPKATLLGVSGDDPEITPANKCQFDWCLELPAEAGPIRGVDEGRIPANRCAVVRCRGDLDRETRAWDYLFQTWLPQSGYQPTHDPALEVYRRYPRDASWSDLDLDCCLPVKLLTRR